jgi:hypothetical protein
MAVLEIHLDFTDAAEYFRPLHFILRSVHGDVRLMRIVQEGEHAVVLFLSERVVFVVVALSALDRDSQNTFSNCVHAVEHRFHPKLFGVDPSFLVDH